MNYENHLSDNINVSSGVPRGDSLSPLLFSIIIKDITKIVKYSNCSLSLQSVKKCNV